MIKWRGCDCIPAIFLAFSWIYQQQQLLLQPQPQSLPQPQSFPQQLLLPPQPKPLPPQPHPKMMMIRMMIQK
ncbi:hypothetical protein ANACOL_02105 [Anaerotruncus colihominis DSM 17241]|uniref:Uncharacterized protein n=1 Tax=Anaerotruncus colihominis DSM 17241 TaxID=445972 RepID=B0PBF4_9FIRM|nr:hypothetical protein ANACOL_02105 [Anaerotruncus colihominis DSM 17241]